MRDTTVQRVQQPNYLVVKGHIRWRNNQYVALVQLAISVESRQLYHLSVKQGLTQVQGKLLVRTVQRGTRVQRAQLHLLSVKGVITVS